MWFEAGGYRFTFLPTMLYWNVTGNACVRGPLQVINMQLSDREIQNTLDLLKRQQMMGEEAVAPVMSAEEIDGIRQFVRQIDEMPPIRQDRVERVRKALEASSYNVTGDDVAKKLIGRIISDKLH